MLEFPVSLGINHNYSVPVILYRAQITNYGMSYYPRQLTMRILKKAHSNFLIKKLIMRLVCSIENHYSLFVCEIIKKFVHLVLFLENIKVIPSKIYIKLKNLLISLHKSYKIFQRANKKFLKDQNQMKYLTNYKL